MYIINIIEVVLIGIFNICKSMCLFILVNIETSFQFGSPNQSNSFSIALVPTPVINVAKAYVYAYVHIHI